MIAVFLLTLLLFFMQGDVPLDEPTETIDLVLYALSAIAGFLVLYFTGKKREWATKIKKWIDQYRENER